MRCHFRAATKDANKVDDAPHKGNSRAQRLSPSIMAIRPEYERQFSPNSIEALFCYTRLLFERLNLSSPVVKGIKCSRP
jgi:hypothetical protein